MAEPAFAAICASAFSKISAFGFGISLHLKVKQQIVKIVNKPLNNE
jgi:hypothetical protein